MWDAIFLCQPLLLSTTVLNDNYYVICIMIVHIIYYEIFGRFNYK